MPLEFMLVHLMPHDYQITSDNLNTSIPRVITICCSTTSHYLQPEAIEIFQLEFLPDIADM